MPPPNPTFVLLTADQKTIAVHWLAVHSADVDGMLREQLGGR